MNTMMELRKCCIHPYLLNGAEEQIQEDKAIDTELSEIIENEIELSNENIDLIVFDLEKPWKIKTESFHSKSKNSPFDNILVQGKNLMTFVRGRLVYKF